MDINRSVKENDAVMFDIDDTLISSRDNKVIEPVYNIYKSVKEKGYKIVIITARPGFQENIEWTERQLREINVQYDVLVFTPPENKGKFKRNSNYNYILSVGDMDTDLTDSVYSIKISM
jgi:ribonucleotide monophosphatase NagD (HAD superfamily)